MSNTETLLQAILDELRSQRQHLGFGWPPGPRRIYANRQYPDCLWYFWNGGENRHEPIEQTALTGYVEKLEIEEKEFRGKPDYKLSVLVRADRPYLIQSGLDTLFSRGLLSSLRRVETFDRPLTICVEPGDTEQVLFCRVYQGETWIDGRYEEEENWREIAATVATRLQGQPTDEPAVIPHAAIQKFFKLAWSNGWSNEALKLFLQDFGYESTKAIPLDLYEGLMTAAGDKNAADRYAKKLQTQSLPTGSWN